jgi:hypothetical protein
MKTTLTLLLLLSMNAPAKTDLERGRAALRAKDATRARAILGSCIEKNPDDTACLWELGWAYYLDIDWARVVEVWTAVEKKDPAHPDVALHLAQAKERVKLQSESTATGAARTGDASKRVRLRAVGDVMLGTDFPEGHLSPEDGAEVMRDVIPLLKDADLTFVNLEGPLCDTGETKKCKPGQNCYAFRSPTRYGKYLVDAGVDLASTANNHSGDFGDVCRRETEATLDKLGIAWSGRMGTIASVEKNGLKIAMIGFHTGEAVNSVNDHATARALVKKAAATHDIVIVSFHGGAEGAKAARVPLGEEEFYGENRGDLRTFTHAVVDAGADLVIGHGPHVLRGAEIYNDRLIAYSLGNFATYGRFNLSGPLGVGAILDVELDGEGRFVGGKIIATKQVDKGIAQPDASGQAIRTLRELSQADFVDTHVVVDVDGTLRQRGSKR